MDRPPSRTAGSGPDEPILHLSVPVEDLEAARAFYVDDLGCRLGRQRDGWIDVWFYGMQLTLQHRPGQVRPAGRQDVRHFGVTLGRRAFDALLDRLADRGVRWLSGPTPGSSMEADGGGKLGVKVADPSGNVIEFKHYPDPDSLFG